MTSKHHQQDTPAHFKGKEALDHVVEAQAGGLISATEMHGSEPPGYLSAAGDAARDTAVALSVLWIILMHLAHSGTEIITLLFFFSLAWTIWKLGRAAWLGWFRLERLHRVLEQERWEIEHHRQQERDELRVLYAAKGFEGKLLEDVLDVLMADNDRLLKVMIEEELGLSLGKTEHPLKQGLGAAAGAVFSSALCLLFVALWPHLGMFFGAAVAISASSALSAYLAKNEIVPAIVWNIGLTSLAIGSVFFFLEPLADK
ncbi:MAG: VIT1/CCC1 transporter family protein [Parachlamydiaceae bacterium]